MARTPSIKITAKPKTPGVSLAGINAGESARANNEGVFISTEFYRNDIVGKPYPGFINYQTQRYLAYNSTVVRSIISLRTQQVAMLPYNIVPSNDQEPTRKVSVFDYNMYELLYHPVFDQPEKDFLKKMYLRIDPDAYKINKQSLYEESKDQFSAAEIATIDHLQEKHDSFYRDRDESIAKIRSILNNPDPWFTGTQSWSQMIQAILFDLIALDRGALLKLRDEEGGIRGLMPMDGASIRPLINEFGFYDDDKAFVQVSETSGTPNVYLNRRDVIIMSMHPVTDMRYFGYGVSPMETLFTAALTDIYIDKGQLDFYRKGGSIPEGVLNIEPPTSRDGMVSHMNQQTLEYMQRSLQAMMAGDYTQVPIFSGGKVSFIDFKGKRRDGQYKELAEYVARKTCAVLQVSPQDVGITSDVNRSSATVQQDLTKSKGLLPLMNTVAEYITRGVVDELRPERDLKLAFIDDDTEKNKNEWTMSQQQLVSGVITVNEYRVAHGKSPVPWGNSPLQGLRNWRSPEEEQEQQGGGLGGLGGAPGGLPPMPASIANPGGPVGGANPAAGRPPAGALKSSRFFSLNARSEDEAEEFMVKGFSEMYDENSNFHEIVSLHDIHNYPGGEWMRTPVASYEHFVDTHPALGIKVQIPEDTDTRDVLLLSMYTGDEIIVENGNVPLIKAMATVAYNNLSDPTRNKVDEITFNNGEEAFEKYIYNRLDAPLQDALYKDYYRFKSFAVSDAQLEEVEQCIS